jgi:hypothetical protein
MQVLSGLLWLATALFLTPRIAASWRAGASRAKALWAPVGFLAWLMVGFIVRWLFWPESVGGMGAPELVTWAALYALSGLLAAWFLNGAIRTRGE